MIAYKSEALDNRQINLRAESAFRKSLITTQEQNAIRDAHPDIVYTPNPFIRIGLFLLTIVVTLLAYGLLALIMLSADEEVFGGLAIFSGLAIYMILEFLIKEKMHLNSGADDAMILMSAGFIITGVNLLSNDISAFSECLLVFILSLFATLRYGNALMAAVAFGSFLGIIFNTFIPLGTVAKAIMPFLIMIISFFTYWIVKRTAEKHSARHYSACLLTVEVLALVAVYIAGNYFVVREVSNTMFALDLKPGESIPYGWMFWIFTIAIPPLYIFRGIQKKDPVLLRTGLLLIAAIVFTIRHYHSILPIQTAMVIAGAILILVAYTLTRYLNVPKKGFTNKESDDPELLAGLHLESIIVAQTFHQAPTGPDESFDFDGGSGGGAGAGGGY